MTEYRECPIGEYLTSRSRCTKKMLLIKWFTRNFLMIITMAGVFFGVIVGFILRLFELSETAILLISYPGELYMRALKLLILPLIISSLIMGSSSVNARVNGKIAIRTFIYFFATSCFNALLGVILAVVMHPGKTGMELDVNNAISEQKTSSVLDSLLDLGRNVIADNIFQATFQQAHTDIVNTTVKFFNKSNDSFIISYKMEKSVNHRLGTNNIGIVFFCIIFGSILGTMGEKGEVVKDLCSTIFDVVMKMVKGVVWITPVGLLSIIAGKIVSVSNISIVLSQLAWFIATMIVGVLLYQLIFLQLFYFFIVKKNPFKYYLAFAQGTLTAFATASAAAALPINFDIMDNKLKINPSVTRFVMPIGVNINMDGTAMFLAVATVFMAQMSGFYIEIGTYVTIWLTSTIISFSSASVPSAALVLVQMILTTMGIPIKNLPLLFAVDWLVDRFRTTNNMLGDCYTAAVVEKLSKDELMANNHNQEMQMSKRIGKEVQHNVTSENAREFV